MKRVFAALVMVALVTCMTTVAFATSDELEILPAPEYALGDVNMDMDVNIKDATAIQKYAALLVEFSSKQLILGDVDLDTKVNIKDATYIQKQIAGLVPEATFPSDDATETTVTSSIATDATEATETVATDTQITTVYSTAPEEVISSAATEVTSAVTEPTEVTQQPTTRNPNKPVEMPFVPFV